MALVLVFKYPLRIICAFFLACSSDQYTQESGFLTPCSHKSLYQEWKTAYSTSARSDPRALIARYGVAMSSCDAMGVHVAEFMQGEGLPQENQPNIGTREKRWQSGSGSTTEEDEASELTTEDTLLQNLDGLLHNPAICLHINGSVVHYDPKHQICCNGVVNRESQYDGCCNGRVYDNRTYICLNKEVQSRHKDNIVCGSTAFNRTTHLCCGANLYPLLQNISCCGNLTFNIDTQICCNDRLHLKIWSKNSPGLDACCDDISYNTGCHVCENERKLTAKFDPSTEVCCEGEILPRLYESKSVCCNQTQMNSDLFKCIDGIVVNIPADDAGNYLESVHRDNSIVDMVLKKRSLDDSTIVIVVVPIGVCISLGVLVLVKHKSIWRFIKAKFQNIWKTTGDLARSVASETALLDVLNFNSIRIVDSKSNISNKKYVKRVFLRNETNLNGVDPDDSNEYAFLKEELIDNEHDAHTSDQNIDVTPSVKQDAGTSDKNFFSTYSKDSHTQTSSDNICSKRTIFGQPFDHTFELDESKRAFRIPDSEIRFAIPTSMAKDKIEVQCSSFWNLPELRRKLNISHDNGIGSPVAEFSVTGYSILPDYAIVEIPFLGDASDMTVWKFESDEGLDTVATSVEVLERTKENIDLVSFYTVEDSCIIVYTKMFSGFYCSRYGHRRELDLRAFIFGSFRFVNMKYEIMVSAYIGEGIFKYKDYQKRMMDNIKLEGKEKLKEEPLIMPDFDLTETDYIKARLPLGDGWIHKRHPVEDRPMKEETRKLPLSRIVDKCSECENVHTRNTEIPFSYEWAITTASATLPSDVFFCTVDLDICKRDTAQMERNCIQADRLRLTNVDGELIKASDTSNMATTRPVQVTDSLGPICQESTAFQPVHNTSVHTGSIVRGERNVALYPSVSLPDLNQVHQVRNVPNPELSQPVSTDPSPAIAQRTDEDTITRENNKQ